MLDSDVTSHKAFTHKQSDEPRELAQYVVVPPVVPPVVVPVVPVPAVVPVVPVPAVRPSDILSAATSLAAARLSWAWTLAGNVSYRADVRSV